MSVLTACSGPGSTPLSPPVPAAGAPIEIEWNETRLARIMGDNPPRFDDPSPAQTPNFDSPREMLRFLLSRAPRDPIVYPSEQYYYYTFPLGARKVSGNIRFADVESGTVSIGYFDVGNSDDMRTAEFRDGKDGVTIGYNAERHEVDLIVDDVGRRFALDRRAFQHERPKLYPGEEYVSGIRDESGYGLDLIYYRPAQQFYYVTGGSGGPVENRSGVGAQPRLLEFGDRTRYCFFYHTPSRRYVLVGVHRREIELNTWNDGPFDQVPPRLPIKAMLEEAYPYVKHVGGIDDHGNFLARPGHRVAISPYREYVSGIKLEQEILPLLSDVDSPEAWLKAVYEPKRDWRPPATVEPRTHSNSASSGWPANHWGQSSRAWPESHQARASRRWPPNHEFASSRVEPESR
ncbi:MAG: hypothetical protein SFY95_03925 [Planctomycetota bacterium]|nr:hypothetical protein [Planctomycetota bacterium]